MLERGGFRGERAKELVANARVNIDALGAHADLASVAETVAHGKRRSEIDVRVLEHDQRIFAAEFKNHAFEAVSCISEDALTCFARACEDDELDVGEHECATLHAVA